MDFSFTTVIIVILLIIIVYFIWTMLSSSSSVVSTGHQDASKKTTVAVPVSANSFSFVTWLYISEWTQKAKNIVSNTSSTTDPTKIFNLNLDANSNNLNLSIGNGATQPSPVPNVPLQTWVCIIVSVNNGNAVDIYLNGKLVSTTSLSVTYTLPPGSYDVGGGMIGLINTTFNPDPTGPQDAWNIYSSGDGSGTGSSVADFFNKYKVRFAFVKDNVELSRLDI